MIMIIAIICIFFIIFDIWSTVKNYFQKIISLPPPPWKNPLSPFHSLAPRNSKSSKSASRPLFANIKNFSDWWYHLTSKLVTMPLPDSKIEWMFSVLRFDCLILPPTRRTSFSSSNGSRLLILLELRRLTSSPCLILITMLISSVKYLLWCNLMMIILHPVCLQRLGHMGILDQRYLKSFFF